MADEVAAFDESRFDWETPQSQKGVSFRVGRQKTGVAFNDAPKEIAPPTGAAGIVASTGMVPMARMAPAKKEDFGISVDWPVNSNWMPTTDAVRNTSAITQYKLYSGNSSMFTYCLEFTNEEHYDYTFYDETGDGYEVNTYRNGNHSVQYNSSKPAIKFVSGN